MNHGAFQNVQGTKDYLPVEYSNQEFDSEVYRYIQEKFIQFATCYGYKEIVIPTIEVASLYQRGVGDTTDVVQKEMYTIETSKDTISLRPEGTAGVARSYIQNKLYASPNETVKLSYRGSMFRRENPQAGRQREFTQLGIEAIGNASPYLEAEVIALADQFLKSLWLTTFELQLNNIGCKECRNRYKQELLGFLENQVGLCEDCESRKIKNPLRTLDCKNKDCQKIYTDVPLLKEFRCEVCENDFTELKRILTLLDIPFTENEKLVRGLDYYSGTAFEFVETSIGAQSTLCGGGRYNGLIEELGGPTISGIGFAIGLERLFMVLQKNGLFEKTKEFIDYYLIWTNEETRDIQMKIANILRKKGFKVEMEFSFKKMKSQFRIADRKNAKVVLVLGEDELANQEITIKNMDTGEQTKEPLINYLEGGD